jgi:hypothetical protein
VCAIVFTFLLIRIVIFVLIHKSIVTQAGDAWGGIVDSTEQYAFSRKLRAIAE